MDGGGEGGVFGFGVGLGGDDCRGGGSGLRCIENQVSCCFSYNIHLI